MKQKQKKTKTKPVSNGIEERMVDLMDVNNPTIITLYGRPGSGKTTILSTAEKPLLIIDINDQGTESAKHKTLSRGDITVFQVKKFDEIFDLYDYIVDNPKKFKSVGIDHMTALQDLGLEKVMDEENKDQVSQRMYGVVGGYMKEIISLYKDLTDLGITPWFLCQDRMDTEGEGEDQLIPEVGPAMMPSLSRVLCAASRVIGHTYLQERVKKTGDFKVRREIEYRLRLGPNPYYITKVTRPMGTSCPDYLVNGTYQDIATIIAGDWKEPEPKKKKKKKKARK